MPGTKQEEVDRLRRQFAERVRELIGNERGRQNLEILSRKTGISARQLSQWQNSRHLNWPSIKNLIALSRGTDVSLDWLILGEEPPTKRKR